MLRGRGVGQLVASPVSYVALDFADNKTKRASIGGSVLLEVAASPDCIISAPIHHPDCGGDHFGEDEYLVDRRRIRSVTVLRRYPQVSIAGCR